MDNQMEDTGRSPVEPGTASAAEEASSRSGIPNAVANLRKSAEALNAYLKSFDEHVRSASDPLFGRGYGLEEKVYDLFQLTGRLAASIHQGLLNTASAIEAASESPKEDTQ